MTLAGNSAILFEFIHAIGDDVDDVLVTNFVDDVAFSLALGEQRTLSEVLNVLVATDANSVVTLAVINVPNNLHAVVGLGLLVRVVLLECRATAPITAVLHDARVEIVKDLFLVDSRVPSNRGAVLSAHGNVDCAR